MSGPVCALWRASLPEAAAEAVRAVARGAARRLSGPVQVFFRADDIGVPGGNYSRLMEIFRTGRVPLCLALVPSWLTPARWRTVRREAGEDQSLWCWHQHGRTHRNREPSGRKCEFGGSRPYEDKRRDLARGLDRLASIVGSEFTPVFTPPWNRMDEGALRAARECGFKAVSRSVGARPGPLPGLPDYPVGVDLHTRKEDDPAASLAAMLGQIEACAARGRVGFMIHHQRMNRAGFDFLRELLAGLKGAAGIETVDFRAFLD